MDPVVVLEARIATLERSLRGNRMILASCAMAVLLVVAVAATRQAQEELRTSRLVLTTVGEIEGVALEAGFDGSLLILDPDGEEIARLGGSPVRRVR